MVLEYFICIAICINIKYESNLHAQELELEEFCASLLVHDVTYVIDLLLPYMIILLLLFFMKCDIHLKMSRNNINNIIAICAYLFL